MLFPEPRGRQREVIYLPEKGHTVILGPAGSGKTTMALLRAHYLARLSSARVLLVTFNKALVTYLDALARNQGILPNVELRNYHHFARGYLHSQGRMRDNVIAEPDAHQSLIQQSIAGLKAHNPANALWQQPVQFFVEESKWIAGCGIQTSTEYARLQKGAGGVAWTEEECQTILAIYENYKQLRTQHGYLYDWDDVALAVEQTLLQDQTDRYYQHVVIDEGQDFTPAMLRSLAVAIPEAGSLTFFGDMAQQIYGNRISWRMAGLQPQAVWEFKENYRNTQQIATLALALSQTPVFSGVADLVAPNQVRAAGLPPTVVECRSADQERSFIVKQAIERARQGSVAILVRTRADEDYYRNVLRSHSVQRLHRGMLNWRASGISVGTYHAAKGLEFDTVLLPCCDARTLPDQERLNAFRDVAEGLAQEARLLYVGITRARTRLIMSYVGQLTSLLAVDASLYQKVIAPNE